MAQISGIESLNKKLQQRIDKAKKDEHVVVTVGFTANYALFVHENIEMKGRGLPRATGNGNYWDGTGGATGQAKFLEQPAREMKDVFPEMIKTAVVNGATLLQALYIAGLRLQRESQLLVPVDTGVLKASAFTRKGN